MSHARSSSRAPAAAALAFFALFFIIPTLLPFYCFRRRFICMHTRTSDVLTKIKKSLLKLESKGRVGLRAARPYWIFMRGGCMRFFIFIFDKRLQMLKTNFTCNTQTVKSQYHRHTNFAPHPWLKNHCFCFMFWRKFQSAYIYEMHFAVLCILLPVATKMICFFNINFIKPIFKRLLKIQQPINKLWLMQLEIFVWLRGRSPPQLPQPYLKSREESPIINVH